MLKYDFGCNYDNQPAMPVSPSDGFVTPGGRTGDMLVFTLRCCSLFHAASSAGTRARCTMWSKSP